MRNSFLKALPVTLSGLLVVDMAFADTWSSLSGAQKPIASTESHISSNQKASPLSGGAAQILFSDIELLKKEVEKLQGIVEEQRYMRPK